MAGPSKGALHTQLVIMLKHCFVFFFLLKMNTTQFRPDYFFYFLWSIGQNIFPTLGGQIIYFIYKNCPCWFFIFFSDNSKCFHRYGFEMYILIIVYTVCTCDTLVPARILNSEISWFCFDFPKWGPVSFIITDFNVFVQFFE